MDTHEKYPTEALLMSIHNKVIWRNKKNIQSVIMKCVCVFVCVCVCLFLHHQPALTKPSILGWRLPWCSDTCTFQELQIKSSDNDY